MWIDLLDKSQKMPFKFWRLLKSILEIIRFKTKTSEHWHCSINTFLILFFDLGLNCCIYRLSLDCVRYNISGQVCWPDILFHQVPILWLIFILVAWWGGMFPGWAVYVTHDESSLSESLACTPAAAAQCSTIHPPSYHTQCSKADSWLNTYRSSTNVPFHKLWSLFWF